MLNLLLKQQHYSWGVKVLLTYFFWSLKQASACHFLWRSTTCNIFLKLGKGDLTALRSCFLWEMCVTLNHGAGAAAAVLMSRWRAIGLRCSLLEKNAILWKRIFARAYFIQQEPWTLLMYSDTASHMNKPGLVFKAVNPLSLNNTCLLSLTSSSLDHSLPHFKIFIRKSLQMSQFQENNLFILMELPSSNLTCQLVVLQIL